MEPTEIEYHTWGLQTEIKIYSELFKLVKYNITPNILCKIATSENVGGLEEFLTRTNMLDDAKKYIFTKRMNEKKLGVPKDTIWEKVSLILTHTGGVSIKELFPTLEPEERRQIMFQIIYNMYVFDILKVSHGDLHTDNILVNILPEEIELVYIVDKIQYQVITKYLVKYFDFDRAMIGKTTPLIINKIQHEQISEILNPIRRSSEFINQEYGVTEIYNKNLDFVTLITHETHGLLPKVESVLDLNEESDLLRSAARRMHDKEIMQNRLDFRFVYLDKPIDEEFNEFMSTIMPGASPRQAISSQTIKDTYLELLIKAENVTEANRIFGTEDYEISDSIINKTWMEYFDFIKDAHDRIGHIIKSTEKNVKNNHLWIPDKVVWPKIDMIRTNYFRKFITRKPYDITQDLVYTIDNIII